MKGDQSTIGGVKQGLIFLIAIWVSGCASQPLVQTPPPAHPGLIFWQSAVGDWNNLCLADLPDATYTQQMDQIVTQLQHAIEVDPDNGLYRTKLAEVLLATRAGSLQQADRLLTESYKISHFWPDYWIDRCEMAIEQKRYGEALQALEGADGALSELSNGAPDSSASQSTLASRQVWLQWLVMSQQLSVDRSTIVVGDISSAPHGIARTQARVAFYRFKIAGLQGAKQPQLMAMVQQSLRFDSDYIPARLAMAEFYDLQGQFQAAESQLSSYISSDTPLAGNNSGVQVELANIYKDWYVRGGNGHDQFSRSRKLYDIVITKHHGNALALLGLAELLAQRTGVDAKDDPRDPDFGKTVSYLATPKVLMDQAIANGADGPDASVAVRRQLARVQGLIGR